MAYIWPTDVTPTNLRSGGEAAQSVRFLATLRKFGDYQSQASSWLASIDLSDIQTTSTDWATDFNAYVCITVMPNGASALKDEDLFTTYYKTCVPAVELQFAKAGCKLAVWLNLIATGSTGP
ncbi:hypothetical protein OIDMADRAFT_145740 [Oidiodendron maius Zn]|uniref:Uncharacterized protein n=1 Tax=Oidiodendron maius (strain Zn) TaxID=913774 RepID=A0A0C3HAI9_OIDMZ|nr:hypothetical protein OIDMADRAFT_145740 [Oidiodendron maius Zn]